MKFGVQVNCYRTTWEAIERSINAMENGDWDSLWFADHFLPPGRREDEHLTAYEGYTLIAVAAGMTKKLRFGHLVLGNTYRNPALLAKMATTLDQASRGRFTLALGAAWFKREHEAYGWRFPSMKERQDRFQEACELIRMLLHDGGKVNYNGKYYQLDDAPMQPGCYQKPAIPIMVGGTGERRTLRTLAMYGDIMNMDGWAGQGMSMEIYKHKVGVLEKHCADVGRDPAEIQKTLLMPILITEDSAAIEGFQRRLGRGSMAGPKNQIIDRIGEFEREGVSEIMFGGIQTGDVEHYERVESEIVSALR
ncbi:MAG: LLM class flavin-dependent oxidoreductase [Gammaproteobacteria bacterium]|nr:LLM class flavin-dependent oxidoreductase [Gammaproteobacteria bacterium]